MVCIFGFRKSILKIVYVFEKLNLSGFQITTGEMERHVIYLPFRRALEINVQEREGGLQMFLFHFIHDHFYILIIYYYNTEHLLCIVTFDSCN